MDITFKNVSYTYQPNSPFEHRALKDISFHIPSEQFVAILGHTGSGKSTLIQHLNGLIRPTKGEVIIGPYRLTPDQKLENIKDLRSKVGIVFQYPEHQLFEETVEKDIAFGPLNFGVSEEETFRRTKRVIDAVGLNADTLERSPFELSGGQMRRVAIAGILAMEPEVLVLDEPTAGLDPRGQHEIMEMFYDLHQREGLTTILVTHHMEYALKYADHIIILNQGTIYAEGSPNKIFSNRKLLQQVSLDVPEVVKFIQQFEDRFGHSLPYHQNLTTLAKTIKDIVLGDGEK